MTTGKADHQPQGTHWILRVAAFRRVLPSIRTQALQWSMAVAIALALGLYLLLAISWKPHWAPFLVLAALIPFVAMIVGDVRKLLLAIILLEIPLRLDVSLLYDSHAIALSAIGSLSVSITTFCLALLYALWLTKLLAKATTFRRSLHAGLPALLYVAVVALSLVVAQDGSLALFDIFLLIQSFLLLLYIINFVQSRQDLLFIITLLLVGLLLESLVMICLRVIGHSISIARIYASIDSVGRVSGTLGAPNTAGSYLSLLLPVALALLLTPLERRHKWLAALAFSLGAVALLLTFSRGAWIAFALSITLLCLLAFLRGWLSPRVPLISAATVLLLLVLFREPIQARLFGDDLGAAASRSVMAYQASWVIKANPVLGVGANNYAIWYEKYPAMEIDVGRLSTVHNKYLLVWAETGIVGLLAFLGFLLSTVHRGWQGWQLRDRLLSPLALGFTVAIIGQMAHMFADLFHNRVQQEMLWSVAGIVAAVHYLGSKRTEQESK